MKGNSLLRSRILERLQRRSQSNSAGLEGVIGSVGAGYASSVVRVLIGAFLTVFEYTICITRTQSFIDETIDSQLTLAALDFKSLTTSRY